MANLRELPSLLIYLDSARPGPGLQFVVKDHDSNARDGLFYPFPVMDESDPMADLMEAYFVTDTGSKINRVFCAKQKSEYHIAYDELSPLTNEDIIRRWKRTFTLRSRDESENQIKTLSCQMDEDGGLLQFQSLFYCRQKKQYFHPPCPKCGLPLKECHDDDFLIQHGLEPFSSSLRRYLYCSECAKSTADMDFYLPSLEASDPLFLKDQWALIKEFSRLPANAPCGFPCKDCEMKEECHGPEGLALSNLVPFSFFPFFMLVFDEASISAPDYLALVSGAEIQELREKRKKAGRVTLAHFQSNRQPGASLFPHYDERFFLEVLYLKLSFLGSLYQTLTLDSDHLAYPDLAPALNRIWVRLADQTPLLPFLWNFKIQSFDLGGFHAPGLLRHGEPPFYVIRYLGLIWFYAFFVNKNQGMKEVNGVIDEIFSSDAMEKGNGLANPAFAPENILWNPHAASINDAWEPLWEKAVDMGRTLLTAGRGNELEWPVEGFFKDLENLRHKVKETLFAGKAGAVRPEDEKKRDEAILTILGDIKDKWQGGKEPAPEPVPDEDEKQPDNTLEPLEDQDTLETIILSGPVIDEEAALAGGGMAIDPEESEDEDFSETIILQGDSSAIKEEIDFFQPRRGSKPAPLKEEPVETGEDDFLGETIVQGGNSGAGKPAIEPEKENKDIEGPVNHTDDSPLDDLDKTMILKPKQNQDMK